MLHAVVPPKSAELSQAPTRIVLGAYLRGLRTYRGETLDDAARIVRQSASAVSRWERAESPAPQAAVRALLRRYGIARQHADFLVRSLPQQHYVRSRGGERGCATRVPFDYWGDAAGTEALARYIAVMRMASEIIEFTPAIPAGLRTQAYQKVLQNPAFLLRADEPVLGLPPWVHGMPWATGQHRTVLLDEAVLRRPVGGPQVMAQQLRHLVGLMEGEESDSSGLVIRIVPMGAFLFVHTVSWPAEVTLHGHRMVTSFGAFPSYAVESPIARTVRAGLREALSRACGREETYELIERAAAAMERRAAVRSVLHSSSPTRD
ncbi:Scr1 family TA system antitoxin-like transcriptional regulator [Streptomyces sp. NPDC093510]|uniref:Scr1 family TA system antitoxin-like transcriptional regulator n=1 Tax=Streptomyces sp. NPDC093510 TaxID=3155199 RepID=UPI0034382E8A